jgi:hypothetical protein
VCSTNFYFLNKIKGNSINNYDFLKFIIYVREGEGEPLCLLAPSAREPSYATVLEFTSMLER